MAIPVYTGLGLNVTVFNGVATIANWRFRSVSGVGETIEVLEDTDLQTTDFMKWVPAALKDSEPLVFETYWEMAEPFPLVGEAPLGTPPDLSFTLPVQEGNPTATVGTFAASGFIISANSGTLVPNERTIGSITFKPDGRGQAPTWTPHT